VAGEADADQDGEPDAEDKLAAPRGEDRDAVEQR
jgi:hypothetical protein